MRIFAQSILLLLLASVLSQCGVAPTATTPAETNNNLAGTDATPTTEAATATPAATATVEVDLVQATMTPAPATVEDADEIYAELVAQFGEDYESCQVEADYSAEACEIPVVLAGSDPAATPAMQVILDSSGSMAGEIDGQPKITAAKEALLQFLDEVPEAAQVAFRVYGHTGSNAEEDRAESCDGTELLYPFQPLDMEQFETTLDAFAPTGWTPIARSLEAAQADFAALDAPESTNNLIYLVSDGIETCDGDPVAAAQSLHESEIQAVINVIGFDVEAEAAAQLQAVATAGGGEYIEARSRADIWEAFEEAARAAWAYHKCVSSQGWDRYQAVREATHKTFECINTKVRREYDRMEDEIRANYDAGLYDLRLQNELIGRAADKRTDILNAAYRDRTALNNEALREAKSDHNESFDEAQSTSNEAFEETQSDHNDRSDDDQDDSSSEEDNDEEEENRNDG